MSFYTSTLTSDRLGSFLDITSPLAQVLSPLPWAYLAEALTLAWPVKTRTKTRM